MTLVSKIGEVLELWSIPTDTRNQGKQIIPDIVHSIFETLDKNNLTTSDILGIGRGSPGQIDYQHGTVCGAYNLGWDEIQEVRDQFEKEFSLPFLIENDANVAALGERWKGAGEFLLTNVKKEFNRYAFPTVRRSTELKLATLGNVAGVIGAASLLL